MLVPPGAAQHMFAAGRQLPQLKQLVLGVLEEVWEWSEDGLAEFGGCVGDMPAVLADGDVGRPVSCCPALERLAFAGVVPVNADMSPLRQLTALTELVVGGEVVDDDVASSVLAQLTRLQRLDVHCALMEDQGLLALTALTRLTRLAASYCSFSKEVSRPGEEGGFLDLAGKVSNWSVWLRAGGVLVYSCVFLDTCARRLTGSDSMSICCKERLTRTYCFRPSAASCVTL
jgi:hypothetical protein